VTRPGAEGAVRERGGNAVARRIRLTTAAVAVGAVLGTVGIGTAVADEIPGTTTNTATTTGTTTSTATAGTPEGSSTSTPTTTTPTTTTKSATTTSGAT